jgi:hypothetical protein
MLIHNSEDVLECFCGDDVWCIEGCPPKLNVQCSVLQKDTNHYYKAKIISKRKIVAFIFVMLTIGVLLKVQQLNCINFGFVMTTKIVMSKAFKGSTQLTC